jgi:RNA polymerase sigma-70 factor (ECF subfamily)
MARLIDQCRSTGAAATTMRPMTDEDLLPAMARGDAGALASLYERYGRAVYSTALSLVTNCAEAEDLVQEAFMRAWLYASSYDPGRGRARTWLLRLTRHLAIDQLRRRRLTLVALEWDDTAPWPAERGDGHSHAVEHEILSVERRQLIEAALRGLPAKQRQVIEYAYFGGLSQGEIAARLGLPLGTVKSRTSLGLRRLRDLISDPDDEPSEIPGDIPCRRPVSSNAAPLRTAS